MLLIVVSGSALPAADYYFSALGNDLTGNGSAAGPWKTIAKFNTLNLDPGDNVFFHAGHVFDGSLSLSSSDTGTNALGQLIAPIAIGSYGGVAGSRATIRSPTNQPALVAQDDGGIEVHDLDFVNGGTYSSNSGSGIQFAISRSASGGLAHFEHIHLSNVAVHGFHQSGLSLYAANDVGYDDVLVSDSEFYGNQYSGIDVSAARWTDLIHRNVLIDHVDAHDNPGYAGCSPHCGHGVVLGQVDGGVIENSTARSNGITAGKGNVGIWAWQSNKVIIQKNQSYGNRSPLGGDGGGFDLDGGVTNSVVQYNRSRNNDGAGYLLAQFEYAEPMSHNTFRYNLSVNDGRDGYGAITVWGATPNFLAESAVFHNNTVVVDHNAVPNSRGPLWFLDTNQAQLTFINNIFTATNGAELAEGTLTTAKGQFANNDYWTAGQPIQIGGVTYASIAQWSAATEQEIINFQFVGRQTDPTFIADSTYRLTGASGLIDAGLDSGGAAWPSWLTGTGTNDLFESPIPHGPRVDIGASEYYSPGDYNRDGVVDVADYSVWRSSFGRLVSAGAGGDGNGNGMVDAVDYIIWRKNYSMSASAIFNSYFVPEPNGCSLLFTLLLIGMMRPSRIPQICEARDL